MKARGDLCLPFLSIYFQGYSSLSKRTTNVICHLYDVKADVILMVKSLFEDVTLADHIGRAV
jgi:hypothetical protein